MSERAAIEVTFRQFFNKPGILLVQQYDQAYDKTVLDYLSSKQVSWGVRFHFDVVRRSVQLVPDVLQKLSPSGLHIEAYLKTVAHWYKVLHTYARNLAVRPWKMNEFSKINAFQPEIIYGINKFIPNSRAIFEEIGYNVDAEGNYLVLRTPASRRPSRDELFTLSLDLYIASLEAVFLREIYCRVVGFGCTLEGVSSVREKFCGNVKETMEYIERDGFRSLQSTSAPDRLESHRGHLNVVEKMDTDEQEQGSTDVPEYLRRFEQEKENARKHGSLTEANKKKPSSHDENLQSTTL